MFLIFASKDINVMVRDIILEGDIKKREGKSLQEGYVSDLKNNIRLGSIHDILNIDMDNEKEFGVFGNVFSSNVLDKLMSGKVYRMLVSVNYEVDGIVKGSTQIKSIMITSTINSKLILERIQRELIRF